MPVFSRRDFLILSGTSAAAAAWSQLFPYLGRRSPIRVALAADHISEADVEHFARTPGMELVGVSGADASCKLSGYSTRRYVDAFSLARTVPADIVVVRLPERVQSEVVRSLANRGLPIAIEAPVVEGLESLLRRDLYVQLLPRKILTWAAQPWHTTPQHEYFSVDIRHRFIARESQWWDSPETMLLSEVGDAITYGVRLLQAEETESCRVAYASGGQRKRHSLSFVFQQREGNAEKMLKVHLQWRFAVDDRDSLGSSDSLFAARTEDRVIVAHCVPRPADITAMYLRNATDASERRDGEALFHPISASDTARRLVRLAIEQLNTNDTRRNA